MRKIIYIFAILLFVSFCFFLSFAGESYNTFVEYVAPGIEHYTITVPSKLAPGQKGEVVVEGLWENTRELVVRSDWSVEVVRSTNKLDKNVLNVYFDGINLIGNNEATVFMKKDISVEEMPSSVLFGKWTGGFNYQVEMVDYLNY